MVQHDQNNRRCDGVLKAMVINQSVPRLITRLDARLSFLRTADFLRGIGSSYDVDLVVLPEHGVQGAPRATGCEEDLAFPEEALEVLAPACRDAGLWAAVSASGGATRGDPYQQMVLIDDNGTVVARHNTGPTSDGAATVQLRTTTAGPGGLTTSLGYADRARPSLVDPELWGAELVIQYWVTPGINSSQVVRSARSLAWTNTCFVVSANAAGSDGEYHWSGYSSLVNYDGALLGLCGDEEYEVQCADFSIDGLRRERQRRAYSSRSATNTFHRCGSRAPCSSAARRPLKLTLT